ncbi:MAG: hypothetical protein MZV63_71420 [Marinilabiliales bacterium]|nr:hypothetical protein [Marinilabiliales bacterium]
MKKIVTENVVDRFDHALMVSGFAPAETVESYRKHFGNVIVSPYQPTCENHCCGHCRHTQRQDACREYRCTA